MPLAPGRRLGSFEVLSLLGQGGMGEVYLARDLRLGRQVALKVLPESLARDEARLARIDREARVLASLNHPGIATLFGLEEADGLRVLVMELVSGATLANHLRTGGCRVEDAVEWGRQVAEALEDAHAKGVIHRDLKPGNIMITPEGRVKVLDFGLAKSVDTTDRIEPETDTLTKDITREGAVVGTVAYMSPEQARGQAVDARTDVWAFGCVLYEMLTGRLAFHGPSPSDVLAAVLSRDPDLGVLPPSTPMAVKTLVRRCLERDRRKRLQSIGDARLELEDASHDTGQAIAPERAGGGASRAQVMRLVATLVTGLALGALVAWPLVRSSPRPRPWFPKRISLPLPTGAALLNEGLAVSPDGTALAYVVAANNSEQVYVQGLAEPGPRAVPGTEGASDPTFSPDGRWLAFRADGKLKKVPVTGGTPTVLGPGASAPSWLRDDLILITEREEGKILRLSAEGGAPTVLAQLDVAKGEHASVERTLLPGSDVVMMTVGSDAGDRIAALSLDTGRIQPLLANARTPQYVPPGHLLHTTSSGPNQTERWALAPFDPVRLRVTGPAVGVLDDLRGEGYEPLWVTPSGRGILAYIAGPSVAQMLGDRSLHWLNRDGTTRGLELPRKDLVDMSVALSPDGLRVAAAVTGGPDSADIWVADMDTRVWTRLTFGGWNIAPVWSPDGRRIAFATAGSQGRDVDLYWTASDGSAEPELLVRLGALRARPTAFTPDGRTLLFCHESRKPDASGLRRERVDLFVVSTEGDRTPRPFLTSTFSASYGTFSPDGRWVAYVSFESGERQVYVRAATGEGRKWAVSPGIGCGPAWSPSGRELFYQDRNTLMVVPVVTSGASFEAGTPRKLLEAPFNIMYDSGRPFDIDPSGQRFLTMQSRPLPTAGPRRLGLIPDWLDEVEAKVRSSNSR